MHGAAKIKSITPAGLTALRVLLLLIVTLFLPQTRVWGFENSERTAPGVFAAATPVATWENGDGWRYDVPDCSVAAEGAVMDSAAVRYSQSSIKGAFKDGGSISDVATGLRNGTIKPESIPPIRLVERNGELFSLDNRRLWSFKEAELPVPFRMATPQEAAAEAWKFTTKNGGTSIRVR